MCAQHSLRPLRILLLMRCLKCILKWTCMYANVCTVTHSSSDLLHAAGIHSVHMHQVNTHACASMFPSAFKHKFSLSDMHARTPQAINSPSLNLNPKAPSNFHIRSDTFMFFASFRRYALKTNADFAQSRWGAYVIGSATQVFQFLRACILLICKPHPWWCLDFKQSNILLTLSMTIGL